MTTSAVEMFAALKLVRAQTSFKAGLQPVALQKLQKRQEKYVSKLKDYVEN